MGYGLRPEGAGFICSTYRDDGDKLAQLCLESIEDMVKVLEAVPEKKKDKDKE
jgi:hypothetical protein